MAVVLQITQAEAINRIWETIAIVSSATEMHEILINNSTTPIICITSSGNWYRVEYDDGAMRFVGTNKTLEYNEFITVAF